MEGREYRDGSGQENEENVARTRNRCGWPSLPHYSIYTRRKLKSLNFKIKDSIIVINVNK